MRLQSAIFDMDGTLLDSCSSGTTWAPGPCGSLGIEPEPDLGEKLKVLTVRQGARLLQGCLPHDPERG